MTQYHFSIYTKQIKEQHNQKNQSKGFLNSKFPIYRSPERIHQMSGETTGLASRLRESAQSAMATRRPWGELLDPTALSLPSSVSDATTRLAQNLTHFRSNYAMVVLFVLFLSLIFHPISMIVFLIVFVAWIFLYFSREEPLTVAGATMDDRVVVAGLGVVTIVALVLTHVWLNVVVSIVIGAGLVSLHAVLRSTDDLVMDDQQSPYGQLSDDSQGTYTIIWGGLFFVLYIWVLLN